MLPSLTQVGIVSGYNSNVIANGQNIEKIFKKSETLDRSPLFYECMVLKVFRWLAKSSNNSR